MLRKLIFLPPFFFCLFIFFTIPNYSQSSEYVQDKKYVEEFLFNDPQTPILGNSNADIYIVEFFDYRCGYCGQFTMVLNRLLEENENIKILYKEWPIFGGISVYASKVALAVWELYPENYLMVHSAFMVLGGGMSKEKINNIIIESDMDFEKIKTISNSEKFDESLDRNSLLAKNFKFRGTPGFIINEKIFRGYVDYQNLTNIIMNLRM